MDPQSRQRALDEATRWFARLRAEDATDADRRAFARWRDASLLNRRAYGDIRSLWSAMDDLRAVETTGAEPERPATPRRAPRWTLTGAVIAAVITVVLAALVYWLAGGPDLVGTRAGLIALNPLP